MSFRNAVRISLAVALVAGVLAWSNDTSKLTTVNGYVLDSACAFTKGLKKPISAECATACAKAGSPLVILTDSGTIYWPIADTKKCCSASEAWYRVTSSDQFIPLETGSMDVSRKLVQYRFTLVRTNRSS